MHALRFLVRTMFVLAWVLIGLLLLVSLYRLMNDRQRERLIRGWSRWLLRFSGIQVTVQGQPMTDHGGLWVANHVSWIDIFLLNSVRATSFIAKQEIRAWPVLGWLVAGVGTMFIERGNRRAVGAVSQKMNRRFERGQRLGLFPEGTTSDGMDVLHFHGGLFEAALRSGAAIQPVALRYRHHGERSGFAAYAGDESLVANVWRVFGAGGVSVDVVFLPELEKVPLEAIDRQAAARAARAVIRDSVREGLPFAPDPVVARAKPE